MVIAIRRPNGLGQNVTVEMKHLIMIFCFLFSSFSYAEELNIKCIETTGTGRSDIFKINNPEFFWYYNNKWYELAVSKKGVAKDWEIFFLKNNLFFFPIEREILFINSGVDKFVESEIKNILLFDFLLSMHISIKSIKL